MVGAKLPDRQPIAGRFDERLRVAFVIAVGALGPVILGPVEVGHRQGVKRRTLRRQRAAIGHQFVELAVSRLAVLAQGDSLAAPGEVPGLRLLSEERFGQARHQTASGGSARVH